MNDHPNDVHLRHLARADVYRLLSACYCQPEEAFLEEDIFDQLKTAMAVLDPDRVPDVVALEDGFRESGCETLLLDYTRLFLGPFDILARPYGSVYLDGENVVMGDSTMQALALYRDGGFEVADEFREVPDHVALELEYLYLLSFRLGQTTEEAEKIRLNMLKNRFLSEHLGRWFGKLAEAMRKGAETEFYRRLAGMTEQFLSDDLQEFAEAV
jgi:putative dimethyl sulfoxide reductase chaperone